ncbi:hemolysin III family protein [Paenibacillus sp. TRM 82003]|uniref:PAQR family membrane homeostasis protein TrhA n=1 Tax=Kineococcus sp. TRM81007 TaxID=2925831 RepID=UPI001F5AA928|nr:hemolysin III family protein [Kineococcus sp. TRM81007]MCI2239122.1 hemolysin III family protein [Kineococcus sp. TRM81007]MCI3924802.1 hemolysin III family protein [Paenibacillus sp. TRM 82003]
MTVFPTALKAPAKPRLRGWLHACTFPAAVVAGGALVALAPTAAARAAAGVFTGTAALLFGTSAVYHRGTWSPRAASVLRRLDHSNIFLIIAGTYTPLAVTTMPRGEARSLLTLVWAGAAAGVAFRVLWLSAPRWLYTPVYVALGWVAVGHLGDFAHGGGRSVAALVVAGGLFYSAGALVYALKRPNPDPRWFGFHEVFHACTVLGFASHFTAIAIATAQHG